MSRRVVVDIGNSRLKWGLCRLPDDLARPSAGPIAQHATVTGTPEDWTRLVHQQPWADLGPITWAVASVVPARVTEFVRWAQARGEPVWVLDHVRQVGLAITLPAPERVGVDRLLNARAALARIPVGTPAIIADIGTAVTVDLVTAAGAFAGGVIFPGPTLMAKSLHTHTALLPLIDVDEPTAHAPGIDTRAALNAGIVAAVVGGVWVSAEQLTAQCPVPPQRFLTGGGALLQLCAHGFAHHPTLTLEGLAYTAEAAS